MVAHLIIQTNPGSYNLMVVGGDPAEFQVEVVDLDNAAAVCPQINIYPLPDGSVGTFINGHAMVCGGYFEEVMIKDILEKDHEVMNVVMTRTSVTSMTRSITSGYWTST